MRASSAARRAAADGVGILRQQDDLVGRRRVRGIDPGRGADEAVARLGDHERRAAPEHARRLAQDHLELARVAVTRESDRLLGRLNFGERDYPPLRLRDDLVGDADDVAVLELDRCGDHRRQVVSSLDLREPFDWEHGYAACGATTSSRTKIDGFAVVFVLDFVSHSRITPPRAASRTASASRRAVRLSFISVRVTCGRTRDLLQRCRTGGIRLVDHERVDQPRVAPRDVGRARPAGEPLHHRVGRALHGLAADERADGDNGGALPLDRDANRPDGEDRPDRDVRVARRDHDKRRLLDGVEDARRRLGEGSALEAQAVDLVLVPTADEPLLERERAGGGLDDRAQPVVGRGQHRHLDVEGRGDPRGHSRQQLARLQRLRPDEVEAEVTIAELKPRLRVAERLRSVESVPGLPAAAPAALFVVDVGERVDDRVEVGRDVQPEELGVVADVPDHRHLARPDEVDEAADEPRTADAAREHDHFRHGLTLPFGVVAD